MMVMRSIEKKELYQLSNTIHFLVLPLDVIMPESMIPLIRFRHFLFLVLILMSPLARADEEMRGSTTLLYSNAFGFSPPIDNYNPGFSVDGGFKLGEHFSSSLRVSYHRLEKTHSNWYEFNFFVDGFIKNESNPFEFYAGGGLGDSIFNSQHGLSLAGHAGVNWWFSEMFGLSSEVLVQRVFGIAQLQDPSFTAGKFLLGVRYQF